TAAINGTGSTGNNVITGNGANNTLDGGAGNDTLNGGAGTDTLIGGLGNDIYVVDSTTDTITENVNAGTDTIQSSVTYTILAANVENLTLTGTAAINGT
ncbi:MAG: furin, partial [Dolichospermum sp.]